jgi:hypothetical protein
VTFGTWLKDLFEKSVSTFIQFGLTLIIAGEAINMSFAHEMATAGIAAIWVVVFNSVQVLALPELPPWADVLARAAKSFSQAALAVLIAAGSGWLEVSVWQGALIAGVVAAATVLKGALAIKAVPNAISPASLAPATPRDAAVAA